jgi:hypothetical protein
MLVVSRLAGYGSKRTVNRLLFCLPATHRALHKARVSQFRVYRPLDFKIIQGRKAKLTHTDFLTVISTIDIIHF